MLDSEIGTLDDESETTMAEIPSTRGVRVRKEGRLGKGKTGRASQPMAYQHASQDNAGDKVKVRRKIGL